MTFRWNVISRKCYKERTSPLFYRHVYTISMEWETNAILGLQRTMLSSKLIDFISLIGTFRDSNCQLYKKWSAYLLQNRISDIQFGNFANVSSKIHSWPTDFVININMAEMRRAATVKFLFPGGPATTSGSPASGLMIFAAPTAEDSRDRISSCGKQKT